MEDTVLSKRIEEISESVGAQTRMGEDYIYFRVGGGNEIARTLEAPVRFYGLTLFMCHSGSGVLEVNLEKYRLEPNTLIVVDPTSLVRTCELDNLQGEMLFISAPFLSDVNFDLQALHQTLVFREKQSPLLALAEAEVETLGMFFRLLHDNAVAVGKSSSPLPKNIARSLVSAMLYQIMHFVHQHRDEQGYPDQGSRVMSSRRLSYVHDFGRLVQKYYRKERSVAFYASKLFISPKYLSLLVKEATGRSAAAWIDEYVIMEAKNMLRFSGRNIQQITYDLNFPNQSAFGKYFKHLTGMSPTQYQKS